MSTTLAQKLRHHPTTPERRLWRLLYSFRTNGYHFRKQVRFGPYVADFACHHAMLAIEVDGDTHGSDTALRNDALRDAYFQARGYTVLRFSNDDVMRNPDGVFDVIAATLERSESNRRSRS
jgi:very-short-patch-repair endonuclease